jgi:hypothetical protein
MVLTGREGVVEVGEGGTGVVFGEKVLLGADEYPDFVPAFGLVLEVLDPVCDVLEALATACWWGYLSMEYMNRTASAPLK